MKEASRNSEKTRITKDSYDGMSTLATIRLYLFQILLTLLVAFSRYFAVNIRRDLSNNALRSDTTGAATVRWDDMLVSHKFTIELINTTTENSSHVVRFNELNN